MHSDQEHQSLQEITQNKLHIKDLLQINGDEENPTSTAAHQSPTTERAENQQASSTKKLLSLLISLAMLGKLRSPILTATTGMSLGYGIDYTTITDEAWEAPWQYGFVALPVIITAIVKLLNYKKINRISDEQMETYNKFIDAFGSAIVATIYGQSMFEASPLNKLFLGLASTSLLTAGKFLTDIYADHRIFKSQFGQGAKFSIRFLCIILMTIGTLGYLLDAMTGLGVAVGPLAEYSVLGAGSLINLICDVPLQQKEEKGKEGTFAKVAEFEQDAFNSLDDALLALTMMFNLTTTIDENTLITNKEFYSFVAAAFYIWVLSIHDKRQHKPQHSTALSETTPLIPTHVTPSAESSSIAKWVRAKKIDIEEKLSNGTNYARIKFGEAKEKLTQCPSLLGCHRPEVQLP